MRWDVTGSVRIIEILTGAELTEMRLVVSETHRIIYRAWIIARYKYRRPDVHIVMDDYDM